MDDSEFARQLVEQGLLAPEQVQECLREQARCAAEGQAVPKLGDILVQKGYLTSSRVRRYVRDRLLGAGGMGEVWKAWDSSLGRWVALKLLKGGQDEEVARFVREAQTAAKLSHPGIVAIYEASREFIAMQYVEGRTFSALPPTEPRRLVELVRDAAEAVHFAHEQGVVHRDLKPSNLMVDADGRVYVMDFGLAKAAGSADLSVSGTTMGTPAYMPPEQARGELRAIDARSDVYALGATLYHVLAGRPPFEGPTVLEILRRVQQDDPVPLRKLNPAVDRDVETVVMKCLEKAPGRRYASARDFAQDLTRYLNGEAIRAHPPSWGFRAGKFLRKQRAIAIVSAVAVAAGLAIGGHLWTQRREAERWVRHARERAEAGEFDEAKRFLDQARTRIPVDPELYARCETELETRRRLSEAKRREDEILQPILKRVEQLPDTEEGCRRGLQLLEEDWPRLAAFWQAWMMKARLHERLGAADAASEAYRRSYELNPNLGVAHFGRGRCLVALGQLTEALAEFERAEERNPGDEYVLCGRALVAMLRHDYAGALRLAAEAERNGGHVAEIQFVRGFVHAAEGEWHDAERAFEAYSKFIQMSPRHASAFNNRGNLRLTKGDWRGAIGDFDTAIRLHPGYKEAHVGRGMARQLLDDLDGALSDFDEAIRRGVREARVFNNRGILRERAGNLQGALADYDEAIRLDPRLVSAYTNRGALLEQTGDPAGALADLTQAIRLNPRSAETYVNRGGVYEDLGDFTRAVADYAQALEVAGADWPHRPAVEQLLHQARERAGK